MAYIGKSDVAFKPDDIDYTRTCYPFDFDPKTGKRKKEVTAFFNKTQGVDNETATHEKSKYGEPLRFKV